MVLVASHRFGQAAIYLQDIYLIGPTGRCSIDTSVGRPVDSLSGTALHVLLALFGIEVVGLPLRTCLALVSCCIENRPICGTPSSLRATTVVVPQITAANWCDHSIPEIIKCLIQLLHVSEVTCLGDRVAVIGLLVIFCVLGTSHTLLGVVVIARSGRGTQTNEIGLDALSDIIGVYYL